MLHSTPAWGRHALQVLGKADRLTILELHITEVLQLQPRREPAFSSMRSASQLQWSASTELKEVQRMWRRQAITLVEQSNRFISDFNVWTLQQDSQCTIEGALLFDGRHERCRPLRRHTYGHDLKCRKAPSPGPMPEPNSH